MILILDIILTALHWLILIDVVLSWVISDTEAFPRNLTRQVTEPLYAPIHAVLSPQKTGGFDVSPLIVLALIWTMQGMLAQAM